MNYRLVNGPKISHQSRCLLRSPDLASQPADRLARFLTIHHLARGVGDCWSASIVTTVTGGNIVVRPVTADLLGHLHRDNRQSTASWYTGQSFQFFVYDPANEQPDVNARTATAMFGRPERTYVVGPYRLLLWARPVSFSPALPPQPDPLDIGWKL